MFLTLTGIRGEQMRGNAAKTGCVCKAGYYSTGKQDAFCGECPISSDGIKMSCPGAPPLYSDHRIARIRQHSPVY